jgi:hypothetical protein
MRLSPYPLLGIVPVAAMSQSLFERPGFNATDALIKNVVDIQHYLAWISWWKVSLKTTALLM